MFATARNLWPILIAIALMTYANIVLKARITALGKGIEDSSLSYVAAMALDPWVWSAVIAAAVTGFLYIIALRQLELSVAEPMFAVVFVLVPLAATVILDERMPPLRIAGLVLIFVGVVLVARTA